MPTSHQIARTGPLPGRNPLASFFSPVRRVKYDVFVNFGKKSLNETKQKLVELGLFLGMTSDAEVPSLIKPAGRAATRTIFLPIRPVGRFHGTRHLSARKTTRKNVLP